MSIHLLAAIRSEARAQLKQLRELKSSADEVTSRLNALGGFDAALQDLDWTAPEITVTEAQVRSAIEAMAQVEAVVTSYAAKLYPLL